MLQLISVDSGAISNRKESRAPFNIKVLKFGSPHLDMIFLKQTWLRNSIKQIHLPIQNDICVITISQWFTVNKNI